MNLSVNPSDLFVGLLSFALFLLCAMVAVGGSDSSSANGRDDWRDDWRSEPDQCDGAKRELESEPGNDGKDANNDEPTRDGEPRDVPEDTVYDVRLPTYSSALGLASPAEVAAALIDDWRGREGRR